MNKFQIIESSQNSKIIQISSENDLKHYLLKKAANENSIILLESQTSGTLTIGVGDPYGFVEFINKTDPPYLIAVMGTTDTEIDTFVEFDSGGTPTPIPKFACLPMELVVSIAIYFFNNGELPKNVNWQEI